MFFVAEIFPQLPVFSLDFQQVHTMSNFDWECGYLRSIFLFTKIIINCFLNIAHGCLFPKSVIIIF